MNKLQRFGLLILVFVFLELGLTALNLVGALRWVLVMMFSIGGGLFIFGRDE